jgi:hypothetical protein
VYLLEYKETLFRQQFRFPRKLFRANRRLGSDLFLFAGKVIFDILSFTMGLEWWRKA